LAEYNDENVSPGYRFTENSSRPLRATFGAANASPVPFKSEEVIE